MNLKGYVLVSPKTDEYLDANSRIVFAYRMGLIPDQLYQSMKVACNGDYMNIDPSNTKCVSDYQTYSDLIRYINRNQILEPVCVALPEEKQRIIIQDSELTVQSIQDPYSF